MRVMFGGSPGVPLITPGAVSPRGTFTRGSAAWLIDSGTGALISYGSNVPRFDSRLGLLMEGQRTNLISSGQNFDVDENIVLAASTTYTLSFYGPGNIVITGPDVSGTLNGLGAGQRASLTFTTTAGGFTNFLPILDEVNLAQLEVGFFASSCIPTISGPVTRLADNLSWALSALGIPASGACTIVGRIAVPVIPSALEFWQIFSTSDGTNLNTYGPDVRPDLSSIRILRRTAGVSANAIISSISSGVPISFAVAINPPSGVASASAGGGSVQQVTGGPTSGLTTLHAGSLAGAQFFYGYITSLNILPYALPDAALPNLR